MQGLQIGRIVHYVLSASDVDQIRRRRVDRPWLLPSWPAGAQAHVGNSVAEGNEVPMMIVAVWAVWDEPHGSVNGQCFLDGNDVLWVTSRFNDESHAPGTWHWPEILQSTTSIVEKEDANLSGSKA